MLHFHQCLFEAGDKALMSCAYPTCVDELKHTSLDLFKSRSHLSPKNTASDRSLSPYPDNSFRTKKLAAVEATEAMASAITTREHECRVSDQFDQMMQMKANSEMYQNKTHKLKWRFWRNMVMESQKRRSKKVDKKGIMRRKCANITISSTKRLKRILSMICWRALKIHWLVCKIVCSMEF